MKKFHRALSALTALLMLASLASCGGGPSDSEIHTDPADTGDTAAESTDSPAIPELEVRNLGGKEINILIRSEWSYEFMIDEETGDTVSDAIYQRNSAIEDNYSCKLNFIDFKGDWSNHDSFTNIIHNSVLAGDGAHDFIAGYQAVLTMNILNGDLMNLYDVPNLQLDAPWWTQEGIESLTYNGRCFEVGGDIAVSLLEGINCMFFNKAMAEDYSIPDLYELVKNGQWTHDKQAEIIKDIYQDLNGNDSKDNDDRFGFVTVNTFIRPYVVAYDTPTISTAGEVIWNNEHTVAVLEKLVDFFAEPDAIFTSDKTSAEKIFSDGRALLMNTTLGASSRLRAMNDDFGIIPYPMFDESQESYYTTTSNEVSMICVPLTAPDPELSGLIIEAMCRKSTDTVAKAFYETALKGKYARDEESLNMIELIRSSLTFDFGWVSSMATGVSGAQYQTMVEGGNKAFASWYASNESTISEKVATFLACFEN